MVVPVCVVLCGSWSCGSRSHWNGCMNVAWAMFWGGSRSTKPCVFPCKVAAAGDERYLVCAAGAAGVVSVANCSSYVFCNEWLFLSCRCKRRIAPKGSIRLVGCRSCTPRPRCALSCAQVMRRAAVRSVKTICRYQHLNHCRISRHELIALSRSPLSWTSPPFYFATGQAKSIAPAARLTTKWLLVLYPLINNTNTK